MKFEIDLIRLFFFIGLITIVSCSSPTEDRTSVLPDFDLLQERMNEKTIEPDSALILAKLLNQQDIVSDNDIYLLGMAYEYAGILDSAIWCFERIIERDPTHDSSYARLSYIYLVLNQPNKALSCALLADSLFSTPYTRTQIANAYFKMDSLYQAIELYEELVKEDFYKKENLYHLGTAYMLVADDENSIKVLTELIELDPLWERGWYARAFTYDLMGDSIKAKKDYLTSYGISGRYKTGYILARLYYDQGNMDSACYYYRESIRLGYVPSEDHVLDKGYCKTD